ncbi:hypothetical protein CCYS_11470 [Corynebacterium cystitidis DSM 20524]|uniref:Uncharacterized protein n=2 Tax=Corynebacterium cystitidis TaxID=35757 RepID=A0A1H9SVL4_9CORY|nr:hypothetical protein CCYS_11470 [Corynebacterium cystitidis DSM 20524]SER88433.1 hypothetical protein SAMN05661109_01272 [Corynebacterium cystitidis DSM 20524]SNV67269.1 Uncharacterised protein [Corynebacterium cystitidis]
MIAEWIAAEFAAGRTDLQTLLDTSPHPRPALRAVAEDCGFQLVDGQVSLNDDHTGATWFVEGVELVFYPGARTRAVEHASEPAAQR